MHACVGPMSSSHADDDASSSDSMNYIPLLKKQL
jgi:hypothetical protein